MTERESDFLEDLKKLSSQYYFDGADVLRILCAKPKTEMDLLAEEAVFKYPVGVTVEALFTGSKIPITEEGTWHELMDCISYRDRYGMFNYIYSKKDGGTWAKII